MAKERDWVDYGNLGANVVQSVQLGRINGKMRQLAEVELQKEHRQQQDAAVAKREDRLREAVFFYAEQLRDLEEIATQNPVSAYIRASHLRGTYAKKPQFKASGLRKFEDKDRLASVQRSFDRLIRETAKKLKPDEQEACEACAAHLSGRAKLVKLIAVQEHREQLAKDMEEKREGLAGMKESMAKKAAQKLATLQQIRAEQHRVAQERNARPFWRNLFDNRKEELAEQAAALEREIAAMDEDIAKRQAGVDQYESFYSKTDEHHSLYKKFGVAKSKDYRQMLGDRDTLLVQLLGDFAKGFVRSGQPPVAVSYVVTADQKISHTVHALMALGFKGIEAYETARAAQSMLGPDVSAEDLVRACLSQKS